MEFDAYLDEVVATTQEVAGDNAAADAVSDNSGIFHGTPLPFICTGVTPAVATADDDEGKDGDIEEVDMPQNEPT